ncbi:helix-turn-helix transcriptional regulator [Dehalococcoides sp. THU3]|uniref:helix-turn-helix domain-containing protein n=1 Tax=Dehalococcoides TaxID=61434 RepID=UPI003218B44C
MSKLIEEYIEKYSNDAEFIAGGIVLGFSERVYQLKKQAGITNKELAKRTELSSGTLSKILYRDNPNVKLSMLVKIAMALGCEMSIVLKWKAQ